MYNGASSTIQLSANNMVTAIAINHGHIPKDTVAKFEVSISMRCTNPAQLGAPVVYSVRNYIVKICEIQQ